MALNDPGPRTRTSKLLECESQRKLDQSRLIDLGCNRTRSRVRCRRDGGVWQSELHPVEEVEDLRAEFKIHLFCDRRLLDQRGVDVIGSV